VEREQLAQRHLQRYVIPGSVRAAAAKRALEVKHLCPTRPTGFQPAELAKQVLGGPDSLEGYPPTAIVPGTLLVGAARQWLALKRPIKSYKGVI
jgi:hypothetical protein